MDLGSIDNLLALVALGASVVALVASLRYQRPSSIREREALLEAQREHMRQLERVLRAHAQLSADLERRREQSDELIKDLAAAMREIASVLAPQRMQQERLRGAEDMHARLGEESARIRRAEEVAREQIERTRFENELALRRAERRRFEPSKQPVRFRAGAPRQAVLGQEFGIRFVVYTPREEGSIDALLKGVDERAEPRPERTEARWAIGTTATVRCVGEHLTVDPPSQTLTWQGVRQHLDFDARIASSTPVGSNTRIKLDVLVEGFIVAKLRFGLEIVEAVTSDAKQQADAETARTAFASYASEDRTRVLDRVASARTAVGLDVWTDCVNLRPNDRWRELLRPEIISRDLFLLFWSEDAAASKWVDWEWRTALDTKGLDAMQLHPLENVPHTVPRELRELHASDPLMDIRAAEVARRAAAKPGGP